MLDLIINTAKEDEKNSSCHHEWITCKSKCEKDCFQDYDVIYVVKDIRSFTSNHNWIHRFEQ